MTTSSRMLKLAYRFLSCEFYIIGYQSDRSLLQVSELSQIHPLCPITTSMAHLARPIVVKRLTSNINIFIDEDICFAIAELTLVKDADFHHFAHLLSRKQKKPASEETGK
jgi:hypothetical protein